MQKTLIGKDGYLFLQNDSARELDVHNKNLCLIKNSLSRFDSIKHKYMITVFPNKSFLYKRFLPDGFDMKYRPGFDTYKKYFDSQIIDGYEILKNETDVYYKTDTHINLKGAYIMYCIFIKEANKIFNLGIVSKVCKIECTNTDNLSSIGVGIGDLTWPSNLGHQSIQSTLDTYYYSDDICALYCKHKIQKNDGQVAFFLFENNKLCNKTNSLDGEILSWHHVSKYILYKNNSYKKLPEKKIVIFYDSFLLSTLSLYMEIFNEVFLVKSTTNFELINHISPDYVFEFRTERFLM